MKIRNKKTGEIWEIPNRRNFAVQEGDISFCAVLGTNGKMFSYHSLAELNKEWEDYKPVEPLIKDEVLRDILRAWAKAQVIDEVIFDDYWKSFRLGNLSISAWGNRLELEDGKTYTIEELCGDENGRNN